MAFDRFLLQVLACPDCRGDILYQKKDIKDTLKCKKCHRIFQIKGGIPIMLPKGKKP